MKVIDLLNKIANGEEIPKEIIYDGKKYHIDELEHFYVSDNRKALLEYIFDYLNDFDALMTEVEIIEEDKKIEKIKIEQDTPISSFYIRDENGKKCYMTKHSKIIVDKVNGIIDKLNKENK